MKTIIEIAAVFIFAIPALGLMLIFIPGITHWAEHGLIVALSAQFSIIFLKCANIVDFK